MYHSAVVAAKATEADTVYIDKLKASLADMAVSKDAAVRLENFLLADQIRQKMIILESQLGSMEYQFNADIIINSITHWQIELAKSMSTRLDDVKAFVRDCSNGTFPLKDPAQLAFNDFVQVVPSNYYDSLVKSLLLIIPNDVAGAQKSPFGWEHFARRIPQIPTLHPDSVEYLRSGLILAILDVIVRVSSRFNESMIKKDTHTLFVKHAFSFLKTASLKRLAMDHEAKMFEKITARWAIILGDLSVVNSTEILRQVFSVIDLTQKQRTPDEIVLILSSVRYIFTRPSAEESPEVIRLIRELVNHYEKTKKAVVKLAVVQCLEKIVQPIDFTSSDRLEAWESQLFRKLAELYDTLTKWGNTSEDMKAATTRVRVAILANSTYEYFQPTMTTLLVELLSKPKPKSFVFHAILQILRGRFFLDTKDTALSKLLDTFSPVEAYGYMPRPVGEESQQTVADRVRYISEQLFIKRKERVPTDSVDIVVAILLQMAAQSLEVTLQLLTYLMTNKSIENAENCYLGLRAVRTIIDPDTGFLSNAVCSRNDPRFPELINGIPYEFDGHLVALLQFCDTVAGISVLGISGRLIEPGQTKSDDSAAATIAAVTKAASGRASVGSVLNGNSSMSNKIEQMYARGETDLIAMLSESMETMNMRNSMSFTATDSFWNAGPAAETKKILEKDLSNEKIDEQNVIVFEAISDWYVKCGQPKSNVKKFAFSSTLEIGTPSISQPVPIDRIGKERIDLVVILLLFKEIIRMLPFIPQPELVFGKLFTGPYLLHSHLELAQETSISLEKTFVKYPEMRIEIIKAILDLIKHTSLSDISYATIMLHLTALIRHWSKDYQAHLKIFDPDQITRLSCKLDACLLIMMARPNPRIRHASLSALSEFYTISQAVLPHPNEPGFLPLQAILDQRASYLSKNAMYAFMERDLLGHKITPKVIGQITLLPLSTIASSDYSYAFKFYLGELARQFSLSGRPKALRHCAKFLTSLAVPYMTSVTTVDSEFVITYSNYMVLMMALAGVPLKSEDGYTLDSYSEADHLLFNNFRHFLSPILNSENTWEIRAIVQASYFIHISLYQLYVVHLWQWYAETRQNSIAELNPRMIDNILYAIRSLSQNRDFEIIAREPSVFQSSIIEIIVDFIRMTQITLQNLDFRSETGILRTKLAINFASVSARLAYSVFTAQRFILDEQDVYIDGVSRPSMFLDITFPGLGWDPQPRQSALLLLKDLTTAVESSVGTDLTVPKMAHYQRILIDKIGVATEMLLVLGDVFDGDALPADLLLWLSKLQRSGFNVYPPPLLYNYENALGTVLAYSYSLAGNTSGFLSAVFNQILPRPMSSLSFGGNYVEFQEIDFALEPITDTANLIFPEKDHLTLKKIRQNIGSLTFCGIYNLLNADKTVRCRAFKFLREIFIKFGESQETVEELDGYAPKMVMRAGEPLKKIAIRISQLASTFFSFDAQSFFWEAVRCSRTATKNEQEILLVSSQQIILEVVLPWARFVNFSEIDEDLVFAEFFRYLMDATFYRPKFVDEVREIWTSIASAPEFGSGNSEVLTEMLLHVRGKLGRYCDGIETLLHQLFKLHHITVTDSAIFYLQSCSLPWEQDLEKNAGIRQKIRPIVKDYVSVLHIALTGSQYDNLLEYANLTSASVALMGELFIQDFSVLRQYLPVALNYSLLCLPTQFNDRNGVVDLIMSLIDGYWGSRGIVGEQASNSKLMQKLISLKQYITAPYEIVWSDTTSVSDEVGLASSGISSTKTTAKQFNVQIEDFVPLILGIFEMECSTLIVDVADEVISWAQDPYMDPETSARALNILSILIKSHPDVLSDSLEAFPSRVVDQVSNLLAMQLEVKNPDLTMINDSGKKRKIKSSERILLRLTHLHGILMDLSSYDFDERCLLFWESICLLKLPCELFPEIWTTAAQNCLTFLKRSDLEPSQLAHHFVPVEQFVKGIQPILINSLFSKNQQAQEQSFELLVLAWTVLPAEIVDSGPTGLFYTCLYVIVWIFTLLRKDPVAVLKEQPILKEIISDFQRVLSSAGALEFAGMIKSLQAAYDIDEDSDVTLIDQLVEKCTANVSQIYFPNFIANAVEFCTYFIQFGPPHAATSLKMLQVFWSLAQRSPSYIGTFKSLIRKLAFFGDRKEIDELFSFILSENEDSEDPIKEIDLTSYGKVEKLDGRVVTIEYIEAVVEALSNLR